MSRRIQTKIFSLTFAETDLLVDAIDYWCGRLNNEAVGAAHAAAGRHVYKRLQDMRTRLRALYVEPPVDAERKKAL